VAAVALELVGDRVARVVAGEAEAVLLLDRGGAVDDAVDLVVEVRAGPGEALVGGLQLLARDEFVVDLGEAEGLEEGELLALVGEVGADDVVGEEAEVRGAALAAVPSA
jgi:hypothetical protein